MIYRMPPFRPPSHSSTDPTKPNKPILFLGLFVLSDFPDQNSTGPTKPIVLSDFPSCNSTGSTKPNEPNVTSVHLSVQTFLNHSSTDPTKPIVLSDFPGQNKYTSY